MRVSDVAYEKIKMMIITARLRPGQTLVEAELMEELGIDVYKRQFQKGSFALG